MGVTRVFRVENVTHRECLFVSCAPEQRLICCRGRKAGCLYETLPLSVGANTRQRQGRPEGDVNVGDKRRIIRQSVKAPEIQSLSATRRKAEEACLLPFVGCEVEVHSGVNNSIATLTP